MITSTIKKISEARFRALTFAILPIAFDLYEEVEWYSDEREYFLASIIYDRTDNDWAYVIMARDENFIFRGIKLECSLIDIESARKLMQEKLLEYSLGSKQIYIQEDSVLNKRDIFELKVPEKLLHKNFILLKDSEWFSPAKRMIREVAFSFVDCDGSFFREFQTAGFDSRIWELYLYAYLNEEQFYINRQYPSPDYLCTKESVQICIEATTVNPPELADVDDGRHMKSLLEIKPEYNAIKFDNSLRKKLGKEYWLKPHVSRNSLVFAIQSFESLGDSNSIASYLYATKHNWKKDNAGSLIIIPEKIEKHVHGTKEVKSGFFFLPGAENVSAILYGNCGTISKFNRMGKIAGFGSERVEMKRVGACFNYDANATMPNWFSIDITEVTPEAWGEGLCMYHNPNAIIPVAPEIFPNISHHFYKDGQLISHSPTSFNPFWSITVVSLKK